MSSSEDRLARIHIKEVTNRVRVLGFCFVSLGRRKAAAKGRTNGSCAIFCACEPDCSCYNHDCNYCTCYSHDCPCEYHDCGDEHCWADCGTY